MHFSDVKSLFLHLQHTTVEPLYMLINDENQNISFNNGITHTNQIIQHGINICKGKNFVIIKPDFFLNSDNISYTNMCLLEIKLLKNSRVFYEDQTLFSTNKIWADTINKIYITFDNTIHIKN